MDLNYDAIVKTFKAESQDHLRTLEDRIIALEAAPQDEEILRVIFRIAHTIKGSASCVGLQGVADFAHALEDLLERVRSRKLAVNAQLTTLLLESTDTLKKMISGSVFGEEELAPEHQAVRRRLIEEAAREYVETGWSVVQQQHSSQKHQDEAIRSASWTDSLRVDIQKLDSLMNLTGEIAIARTRIRQMLEETPVRSRAEILEMFQESERLHLDLQEMVMKVRMVPLDATFRQYVRTVRDLARSNDKAASLAIEGGDAEVDTTVVEHLRDPLAQMIRNAIDHGIEQPHLRISKGKDATGRITISAYREAGSIVIQVSDDGAGLNRDKILTRARELGLVSPQHEISDQDAFQLIMEPGFSTADAVTEFSGRGVGMDVVRRNIEALGGSVSVDSRNEQGTTITLRLPLTLAIVEGLSVAVSGETFVIPLSTVIECLDLSAEERTRAERTGVVDLRGRMVPYLRLRKLFDFHTDSPARENLVVVRHESRVAGLAVDALQGESQVVIKPLGKLFYGLTGVSGSTILGNGRVALILDVATLLRGVAEGQSRAA